MGECSRLSGGSRGGPVSNEAPNRRTLSAADRVLSANVFVVLLMIVVGYALGFRFHGGVVAAVVIFANAFSWISALIGVSVRDVETVQVAGFV